MQVLGEDLVAVLDTLHIRYVIGLGEGAGANVVARFGLAHPSRVLGLILINCTGSATSVKENFKSKVSSNNTIYTYFNISILSKNLQYLFIRHINLVRQLERKIYCEPVSNGLLSFPQVWTCKLTNYYRYNFCQFITKKKIFALITATYE